MQTNKELYALLEQHKPHWYKLGLNYENAVSAVSYFCTPERALIFASLGVDGIHYCLIPGLGDTVFVVNPMPADEHYVFPAAKNLAEFMCLVTALEGTQLIDQLILWDEEKFKAELANHLASSDDNRKAEIDELTRLFKVTPMSEPYNYVRTLVDSFDYSRIEYTDEYYETLGLTPVKHHQDDFFSVSIKRIPKK